MQKPPNDPSPQKPNLAFHFLRAFSLTGGIEKVNRCLLAALSPDATDSPYEPHESRASYMLRQLTRPIPEDILLLAHINLAPAAILLKTRKPSLKIWLMAHGIEVWEQQYGLKKKLLHIADQIFAVSHFTAEKIKAYIPDARITVMPNCLGSLVIPASPHSGRSVGSVPLPHDPWQPFAGNSGIDPTPLRGWDDNCHPVGNHCPPAGTRTRYGLHPHQKVLLTITRLSSHELYKGYDLVLGVLPELLKTYPDLHYLIGGKADEGEQQRLVDLIAALGLKNNVTLCGFIPDEELTDHYCLADLFVMPSQKEGFGLVFIEAMACGTPALGGNKDGSVEALTPYGHTVDPEDKDALRDKILEVLKEGKPEGLGEKVRERFGFEQYVARWRIVIPASPHSGRSVGSVPLPRDPGQT